MILCGTGARTKDRSRWNCINPVAASDAYALQTMQRAHDVQHVRGEAREVDVACRQEPDEALQCRGHLEHRDQL